MITEHAPPSAVDIERSVLGAMIFNPPRAITAVHELGLEAHHFYHPPHRKIYTAIVSLHFDEGEAVDRFTLAEFLKRLGTFEDVGGEVYLWQLADEVATWANVRHHAGIVLEKASQRELMQEGYALVERVASGRDSAQHMFEELQQFATRGAVGGKQGGWVTVREGLVELRQAYERAKESDRQWAGHDCGFPDINEMISGLCPGELTIIGARPNIGKTTLALQMATTVAESGVTVAFFSIEMTTQQLLQRLVCIEAGIDVRRLRSGKLNEHEQECYENASERLSSLPLHLDFTPALTAPRATAKLETLLQDNPVGLVVIDYLQLMDGPGESKNQMLEAASTALQSLAKSLNIHFLVLSQLSRGVEMRDERRPRMSDLRDSGGIEQSADNVMLIHRPGKYEDLAEKWKDPNLDIRTWVQIIHDKTRFGPTGTVELVWIPETAQFASKGATFTAPDISQGRML